MGGVKPEGRFPILICPSRFAFFCSWIFTIFLRISRFMLLFWEPVSAERIFPPKPWKNCLFLFHVDSSCGWVNSAPINIKRTFLWSREGVFQFSPVPISCPHPELWSSLALGEVGRKASLSIPMPCGFLYADFCVRIFVCGFFVRIFHADFACGFSCGFWIFCVRISVRIFVRIFFGGFFGQGDCRESDKKILPKKSSPKSSPNPPRIFASQPSLRLKKSRVHTWVPVALPNFSVFLFLATFCSGWCRSSRLVLRTSKLRKKVPWQNLKYRKCNTHCQSQSMHLDTSLGQGVFHGWRPLPLQDPKKPQKITKKILTAAQQIPGGQFSWLFLFLGLFWGRFVERIRNTIRTVLCGQPPPYIWAKWGRFVIFPVLCLLVYGDTALKS